jgi:hypothetical protein
MSVIAHPDAPTRDILTPRQPETAASTMSVGDILHSQSALLADIAVNLRKRVPDVRATTVVHNTALDGSISDDKPRRITFEIGGRPVEVSRLLLQGPPTTGLGIRWSLEPVGQTGALLFPASTPIVLDLCVSEIYVMAAAGNSTAYTVNRLSAANYNVTVYGFTVQQWALNQLDKFLEGL